MAAGVPEEPVQVWAEGFSAAGTALIRLPNYDTGAYTADPYWLDYPNCNGVIVTYNTVLAANATECTSTNADNQRNARLNIRRMADVLGQVGAGFAGSTSATAPANNSNDTTRANRALAEWTSAGSAAAGATRVLDRTRATGITATAARYYTTSIDIVEASCSTTTTRSQIVLSLAAGTASTTGTPITACTDARAGFYTSPLVAGETGWVFGGASVRAGRFTPDTSLLVPANQIGTLLPTVRNLTLTSGGNDFAVDNLRILDVTPSLDWAFTPDTVVAGTPTTLTYTITNTSELASKNDWSFSNSLPAGVVVAPTPGVGGTCVNSAGTAFAVTAAAGASTIGAVGGDLAAGAASCTITVNVVAASAGTYTNAPGNVTTMLVAPDPATLTVQPPSTITVLKNITARNASTDQFTLSLRSGTSVLASATTTGTATGVQAARINRFAVQPNATYTIHETPTAGAGLTYAASYECVRGATVVASGDFSSGSITMPSDQGADIVCTFTNTPQTARLACDTNHFYTINTNGALVQGDIVSGATASVGTWPNTTTANGLGIGSGGTTAYALQRSADATDVSAILKWTAAGGFQTLANTAFTTTAGGTEIAGSIVAGAVDLTGTRYVFGKFANSQFYLWSFTESNPAATRFSYIGAFPTGTAPDGNGDLAFDAQGNLYVIGAATVNNVSSAAIYTVTAATLAGANGGTLAVGTSTTKSLTGTDATPAFGAVNGISFSPRGTAYLSSGTSAYEFDPTTWARVPNTARVPLADNTDAAACTSPATVTVLKNVVGRAAAADQFTLTLANGGTTAATATTAGTTTGRQAAQIGPVPVPVGTVLTISEAMAAGSTSALGVYRTLYECYAGGVRIASGTTASGSVTMPNTLSVNVTCTYFNTPQPAATVTITKQILDPATGAQTPAAGWTVGTTATPTTGYATIFPNETPRQQTAANGTATWSVLYQNTAARATLTFSEVQQAGYAFVSASCTVGGAATPVTFTESGGVVSGSLAGTQQGQTINCTFVNRPIATLTLRKQVLGDASPNSWTLTATRQVATALAGPSGPGVISGTVSPGVAYRLTESTGPALYVPVGGFSCVTSTNETVPVSAAGDVTLARGTSVTCTIVNGTASVTLLKNVQDPSPGFQPSTWNLTATPATLAGLSATTVGGADFDPAGNAASTFNVRPGHSYTLSEALAASGTRLAYRELRLERRVGTTWVTVSSPTITAPAAGQTAVYRFVNAPVEPTRLPLTGGASTDAFVIGGLSVLTLALALAVWHSRRRRRGAM